MLENFNKERKIMYRVNGVDKSLRSLGLKIKQEELIEFPTLQEEVTQQQVGNRNGDYYKVKRYLDRTLTITATIKDVNDVYAKIDQIYSTFEQKDVLLFMDGDKRGLMVKKFELQYNRGKRTDEVILHFTFEPFTVLLSRQWNDGYSNSPVFTINNNGFVETDYLTLTIKTNQANATIEFNGVLIPLYNNVVNDTITINCRTMEITSQENDVLCICMFPTLEKGVNTFITTGITEVNYKYMKLYR